MEKLQAVSCIQLLDKWAVLCRKKNYVMRYVTGHPVNRVFQSNAMLHIWRALPIDTPITPNVTLRILVWNIFKQQRAEWLSVLQTVGKDTQLILLQEAQTTPELVRFATANYLAADQVPAFFFTQHPSGVMTLASAYPVYCYPLREREPFLRLAKSALITAYPLPNGKMLMVINIHAVNFSLGVAIYSKQLSLIGKQLTQHTGPVIMAGDFNAWSRQRMDTLCHFAYEMKLCDVRFTNDYRRKAFGRPLDYVFYRELHVVKASVLVTRASDHNPMLVEFTF